MADSAFIDYLDYPRIIVFYRVDCVVEFLFINCVFAYKPEDPYLDGPCL